MHYTNAIEYISVLQGDMEVRGPDGETSKMSQGGVFVLGADAHQVVNVGQTSLRELSLSR